MRPFRVVCIYGYICNALGMQLSISICIVYVVYTRSLFTYVVYIRSPWAISDTFSKGQRSVRRYKGQIDHVDVDSVDPAQDSEMRLTRERIQTADGST